jgi:hypothetical protein
MLDLIIDIPDDAGTRLCHEESVVPSLQVQLGEGQQSGLLIQPTPDTPAKHWKSFFLAGVSHTDGGFEGEASAKKAATL